MALRDVEESDLPIFFEHQNDPEANRMAAFPAREWDAFVEHWRVNVLSTPGGWKKTIVVDGKVAGHIVSWEKSGRRLVGYWIGRAYWGRGIATGALLEFLEHETTRPLSAYVAAHNVGSIRVLEKCGFRRVADYTAESDGVEEYVFKLVA